MTEHIYYMTEHIYYMTEHIYYKIEHIYYMTPHIYYMTAHIYYMTEHIYYTIIRNILHLIILQHMNNHIYPSYFLNEFETDFDSKSKFCFDLIGQLKVKFDFMNY